MKLSNNNKQKTPQNKCSFLRKLNLIPLKVYQLNHLKLPNKIVKGRFKIRIFLGILLKILRKKLLSSLHILNSRKRKLKISLCLQKKK